MHRLDAGVVPGSVVVDAECAEAFRDAHAFAVIPAQAGTVEAGCRNRTPQAARRASRRVRRVIHFQLTSGKMSRHRGLFVSINSIFHARFHSLMAFSCEMAEIMDSCCSYQTSACTRY